MNKHMKKIIRGVEALGWTVEPCKSGHFRLKSPDGTSMVIISKSPSDQRALQNVLSDLRRAGCDLKSS